MPANRFELLATWYLRFNGFFTTPAFTIHPDEKKKGGGTDADVLAVRFRHSVEYQAKYCFERDAALPTTEEVTLLICEVKASVCDINKTWRDSAKGNVEYALRWMGFIAEEDKLGAAAKALYEQGAWCSPDDRVSVRFVSFGKAPNEELQKTLPRSQSILHAHVIAYLRRRFTTGCVQIARQNWNVEVVEFARRCENPKIYETDLLAWAAES